MTNPTISASSPQCGLFVPFLQNVTVTSCRHGAKNIQSDSTVSHQIRRKEVIKAGIMSEGPKSQPNFPLVKDWTVRAIIIYYIEIHQTNVYS